MTVSDALAQRPIGVFDSGVGGLTVLNALHKALPHENLLYLGDTARVPYGTKSELSVTRYAEQAAAALIEHNVKLLIIACNTASAVAVEPMKKLYPDLNVIGVIEPGAEASCQATENGIIGVIGTEGTVNRSAYKKAIHELKHDTVVVEQACSLFVALAEEGWHQGELVEQVVAKCLAPLIEQVDKIDTLVLGCTHFPALRDPIQKVIGEEVTLVDSAETTARAVAQILRDQDLVNPQDEIGAVQFMVTDGPERFSRVAKHFFSGKLALNEIRLVDIQHFSVP